MEIRCLDRDALVAGDCGRTCDSCAGPCPGLTSVVSTATLVQNACDVGRKELRNGSVLSCPGVVGTTSQSSRDNQIHPRS